MNLGKTLFAQLMDFLPWKTFHRIVDRHNGDPCDAMAYHGYNGIEAAVVAEIASSITEK